MDQSVVNDAVRVLRARGERVSVRAVHNLISGGSYRDLTRLLRAAKGLLAEDEVADLEGEAPDLTPPPGQLTIARDAVDAAEGAVGEVQNMLDAAQTRLSRVQR